MATTPSRARFCVYGLALAVALLGAGAATYVAPHSATAGPLPAAPSQELATAGAGKGSGDGLRAGRPTAAPNDVPEYLNNISVTTRTPGGEGSGVLKRTKDGTTWVWTAAHVVADLRKTRQAIDPKTGATRTVVTFDDAKVIKMLIEDGRTVGRVEVDAEVIRYSDASHGEDLALLRVRKKSFIDACVNFYSEKSPPPRGTELFHSGSLLGEVGSNSLTEGILSQQADSSRERSMIRSPRRPSPAPAGGGVYRKSDGRLIGLLVRGAPGGFSLIVPVRRMEAWAKKAHVEWAIRDDVPVPGQEELEKLPIEDESSVR